MITIYGKEDCTKCQEAKAILWNANYKHHEELYDDFSMDIANSIVTASNGQLPIIIFENQVGRLQLTSSDAVIKCKDGSCSI